MSTTEHDAGRGERVEAYDDTWPDGPTIAASLQDIADWVKRRGDRRHLPCLRAAVRALAASPAPHPADQPAPAGKGWVLVPREPTLAMLAWWTGNTEHGLREQPLRIRYLRNCYAGMIEAAPNPLTHYNDEHPQGEVTSAAEGRNSASAAGSTGTPGSVVAQPSPDQVEALALRLFEADPGRPMHYWESLRGRARENYREMARAALRSETGGSDAG